MVQTVVGAAAARMVCVGALALLGDRKGVQHLKVADLGEGRLVRGRVWGGWVVMFFSGG